MDDQGVELVGKRGQWGEGEGRGGEGGRFDISAISLKEVSNIVMDMIAGME